jgi:FkbM family methyltransferase
MDGMHPEERAPEPIERARALVDEGAETSWDAPSRFRTPGLWARRALRRILRPYAFRQHEIDRALLEAIQAAPAAHHTAPTTPALSPAARAAAELATPLPDRTVEVATDVGSLLLDEDDTLITPLVTEHRSWEGDVVAFLRSRLGSGMTFVDVGAHVGYFSVLASGIVGEAGRVLAVEPEPRNLALLRANLWRNGCDNVAVLPVAAYERRGHVRFVSNPEGLAGSWIDPEQGDTATMAPCAPLDSLLGDRRVDVIKVDIERAEPEAIQGAERLICRSSALDIVAEFWPTHPYANGRSPADVLAYYESLGLELRLLHADGSTTAATAGEVFAQGGPGPIMNIVLRAGQPAQE